MGSWLRGKDDVMTDVISKVMDEVHFSLDRKSTGGWYIGLSVNAGKDNGSYVSVTAHVTREQLVKLHKKIGNMLESS